MRVTLVARKGYEDIPLINLFQTGNLIIFKM